MIVLIGASASGKTEISKILSKEYNYKKCITTTTRPMRKKEVDGVDYYFVEKDQFIKENNDNNYVAVAQYQNNWYGLNKRSINKNALIILEPKGANELIEKFCDQVFVVYIESKKEKRQSRMLSRGDSINSIENRLKNDDLIFSTNKLLKIDFFINNNDEPLVHHAKIIYEKYEQFKNKNILILKGRYANAKIFTNKVEQSVIDQLNEIINSSYAKNTKIRVMPDVHSGFGVPIGYTQNLLDKVVPNFVGVDIGCGMLVTKIANYPNYTVNFNRLEKVIKENVPSGFNVFDKKQDLSLKLEHLIASINLDRAYKSIGTLGGGNHFIELNQSEKGLYLVIHSGSRHLGVEVCNYWQNKIDPKLGYLIGDDFNGYLKDMKIAQKFASLNRMRMRDTIITKMKWDILDEFETVHNYIDLDKMILRKGAISAQMNEKVIIPINMRDGSLIALGLGNDDWNYSAPHGAGRVMSRTQAKSELKLTDFEKAMEGIWSNSVSNKTLDEAPFVYKDINEIINNTKDTIKIVEKLKVLYNYKA